LERFLLLADEIVQLGPLEAFEELGKIEVGAGGILEGRLDGGRGEFGQGCDLCAFSSRV
jgi:hypothetical protein